MRQIAADGVKSTARRCALKRHRVSIGANEMGNVVKRQSGGGDAGVNRGHRQPCFASIRVAGPGQRRLLDGGHQPSVNSECGRRVAPSAGDAAYHHHERREGCATRNDPMAR
jgi:hypothetical protein